MPATLTYFGIRARGEYVRLALHLAGIPFENNFQTFDSWGAWKAENSHRLLFGQAPHIQFEDGFEMVQSNAILRHIGRTSNLYGKNFHEQAVVDQLIDGAEDWRGLFIKLIWTEKFADDKVAEYKGKITTPVTGQLAVWEGIVGKHAGGFLIGDQPTVADASFADLLDLHLVKFPEILDNYPALKAYHARFFALPKIAEYVNSNPAHRNQTV
eukprot:GILI01000323.1.p1 GENE.GILI01000323.1~~GILI01000323.1.p1  ORF type:complete len:223 (-),score=78.41 GILI01000323.1:81-716(-)